MFLEDIRPFTGTGEKNTDGETLEEFLEHYDPHKYETPSCTTDTVVFAYEQDPGREIRENRLKVLMVLRSNHPSIGFWALPGGFAEMKEDLDRTAARELEEETGVSGLSLEQFAVYGDWKRDPRTRVITTAYMTLVEMGKLKVKAGDDAADACWCQAALKNISCEEAGGWEKRIVRLHLSNKEKGLDTTAEVEAAVRKGLIRETHYSVIRRGQTAADHAAVITQALELLNERAAEHFSARK